MGSAKIEGTEKGPSPKRKPHAMRLIEQIMPHQLLQQLVAIQLTDQAAGIIVIGDIRRVLGENVADDLVDGVIALLGQRAIDLHQGLLHLLAALGGYGVLDSVMIQNDYLLHDFSISYTKFP